jgi:beta-ureidopropionase / N-carbamoyl-L-amino-acid hydrolase
MERVVIQLALECEASHSLKMTHQAVAHMPAAQMDDTCIHAIQDAADALGMSTLPLASYSGHDAQIVSRMTPSGMIFVPSLNGISHHPDEYTEWSDVVNGANVLLQAALRLALAG